MKAVVRATDLESADSAVAWFYRILSTVTAAHFRSAFRERKAVEALETESDAATPTSPPQRRAVA
jgi:DNA-directed RNA polymerase specialized sigma24 family protein